MKLSIIIVNWNTKTHLKWCLYYVYRRTRRIDFEIFVVDNASKDNSAEMVEKGFPEVNLIRNKKNLGFAKANNQAIKKAKGEYILLLNSDTKILDQALVKMVELMDKNARVGILGCKLLNPDGTLQPSCRRFPSLKSQTLILLKLHNLLPNLKAIRDYYTLDWKYNKTKKVDQVMGACFMVRKKVFEEIGLLDEKYFIWFEEVDFCKRAKDAGWDTYFLPNAQVVHEKAASFDQLLNLKRQIWFNNSLLRYFKKHERFGSFIALLGLYPISLALSGVAQLSKNIRLVKKNKNL
jgi:hypothetical protein